jgi:hypothetical protein
VGCLTELGTLPQETLAGESACPTLPHKTLILRGGAGASACQRSAKDGASRFRLSTRGGVASKDAFPYAQDMEVHFNPDLQAKLDKLATETGRPPGELVEDVVAGYFDEFGEVREMLNSRYDDLKSGRVKPIPGDEVEAYFREKTAVARRSQPGS